MRAWRADGAQGNRRCVSRVHESAEAGRTFVVQQPQAAAVVQQNSPHDVGGEHVQAACRQICTGLWEALEAQTLLKGVQACMSCGTSAARCQARTLSVLYCDLLTQAYCTLSSTHCVRTVVPRHSHALQPLVHSTVVLQVPGSNTHSKNSGAFSGGALLPTVWPFSRQQPQAMCVCS